MTDKTEILDKLKERPVARLLQMDGFIDTAGDPIVPGDDEGDKIMTKVTHELMRSPCRQMPVRVLIHEDADPEDVRRLLGKMLDALEDSFGWFRRETGLESEPPF